MVGSSSRSSGVSWRQRHREPHALAPAARQLVDRALGDRLHPRPLHRLAHRALVLTRPLAQQALVRVTAAGDQIGHRDAVGRRRALRQQAEPAGHELGGQRRDLHPVEEHGAGARLEHPDQRAQQCRLAARVRTDDGREAARGDVDGQPARDDVPS
jgi:hypothetical protein